MGYYWKPYQRAIDEFFEWLFADKRTKKMLECVPRGCRHCEVLGICRDEENNWKCRNGCQFIKKEPIDCDTPVKLNTRRFRMFKKELPIKRVVIAGCRKTRLLLFRVGRKVQTLLGNNMLNRTVLRLNDTLQIGTLTVKVQVREETRKWQRFATLSFAFGTVKAKAQR